MPNSLSGKYERTYVYLFSNNQYLALRHRWSSASTNFFYFASPVLPFEKSQYPVNRQFIEQSSWRKVGYAHQWIALMLEEIPRCTEENRNSFDQRQIIYIEILLDLVSSTNTHTRTNNEKQNKERERRRTASYRRRNNKSTHRHLKKETEREKRKCTTTRLLLAPRSHTEGKSQRSRLMIFIWSGVFFLLLLVSDLDISFTKMFLYSSDTAFTSYFATPMKLTLAILFDGTDDRLVTSITTQDRTRAWLIDG